MARLFGSAKQLPSGAWQASFPDPTNGPGERRRILAPTTYPDRIVNGKKVSGEVAARKWLTVQEAAVLTASWKPPTAAKAKSKPTLTEYHAQWLADRTLAPKTAQDYRWLFVTYIEPAFGKLRLDQVEAPAVRTWVKTIAAPTARAKAYSHLKTVLGTAEDDELIDSNPCRVKKAGTAPKRKKTITVITVAQLNQLVAAMPAKYKAPTLLMAWGVLRWSELSGLQRADIDGTAITVRRGVVRLIGEGLHVGDTKTDAGERTVYVPPGCARALEAHLAEFVGPRDDSWLMTAISGGPLSATTYVKALKRAAAKVGVPELSCHMLRHSGNTWMRDDGASDAERLAQAGHTAMAMNEVYTHDTEERLQTLAERRAARETKAAAG